MIFKDDKIREEFTQAPAFLQIVANEFEALSRTHGVEPIMTRVRENVTGSSGVHEAGRALDFRDEHEGKFLYSEDSRHLIVETLNTKFKRNDGKNTAIWHSFQGRPHHFHVQIAAKMQAYEAV